MCSIAASMATMAFNREFRKAMDEDPTIPSVRYNWYLAKIDNGAMFDARVFNIPKEEVANLIYWRQLDATRNSIQMVGQANFSHKELQNKSCNQIQDMLFQERDINWNDFPTHLKRGSCCVKVESTTTCAETVDGQVITWAAERPHWEIDLDIPLFKGEGREYVNSRILYDENPLPKVCIN
jgi:tRNA(His) 5'-end guanylyltransferase